MRKILFVVMALLFSATMAHAQGVIAIVPADMPECIIDSADTDGYWSTKHFMHAVGVAPKMNNPSLQKTTAENRAYLALATGVRNMGIKTSEKKEITAYWKDPSTNELYACARIRIIAPKK